MITIRKSEDRGLVRENWLESRHTFSFDTYHDPDWMRFRNLRVINEDWVAPGNGFPMHPHRDMEIVTFILEGALEHRDSMGNRETIRAGELQRITAGSGIRHSEANPSDSETVHLLQIWIFPDEKGLEPSYEVRRFGFSGNGLRVIASRDGRDGSAVINQDVSVFAGSIDSQGRLDYSLTPGRHAWIQVIEGQGELNGNLLSMGDGAAVSEEPGLALEAKDVWRFLLFDLN